jgi:hypothetical protein
VIKSIFLCLILGVIASTISPANASTDTTSPTTVMNINRDWRFTLGDPSNAQSPAFDDHAWESIGLPHSFSIPYFLSPDFYVGYGWYRKHFNRPTTWAGKRISIEFDGVFQEADVFLNGKPIGSHQGGYTGFCFDLTSATQPGDNVLAVRVNNLWIPTLNPRAGEHVFSGGIYRNVRLIVTAPLHLAWNGVFITTPDVSKTSATVNIKSQVQNDATTAKTCRVRNVILDPDSKLVAQIESSATIPPGQSTTFDQTAPAIANPRLWHPDHPWLYTVVTTIFDGDAVTDETRTPLGIRSIKFTADQGFFLNGEHLYLRGANVHQDHAGWGDAVTDAGAYRDVKLIKDAGFNFIRGSHYPHSPAFLRACDELGIMFWSENCFWGTGKFKSPWGASAYPPEAEYQQPFDQSVKRSLREMIQIDRNHPCVIAWSMDNEVFFTDPSTLPDVQRLLSELVKETHDLDPTRPAAIGGCQRGDIDKLGDLAGYNGDGARLFPNPGIPNLVSEYGSVIADRPGKYDPGWGDLPTTPGPNQKQPYGWRYPWRSGESIWCGFDHGSLGGKFGSMGLVDYFRLPKRAWYWYRNENLKIPPPPWPKKGTPAKLALSADKTEIHGTDATDDVHLIVTVEDATGTPLSNSPPVTFSIISGPGQFPTGPAITFDPNSDIAIRDGQAAIEFRSYDAGTTLIRASSPGLADATITITTTGTPQFIPGQSPPAHARPYVRFTTPGTLADEILGRNNPTSASSEAPAHPASLANDGSPDTFWSAATSAPGQWWQVDLERLCDLKSAQIHLPEEGNFQFRVEISPDARSWQLICSETESGTGNRERDLHFPPDAHGRYVRITFNTLPPNKPAAINEALFVGSISSN